MQGKIFLFQSRLSPLGVGRYLEQIIIVKRGLIYLKSIKPRNNRVERWNCVDVVLLETMNADALDEQDFDEGVRKAFASEEGQAILKKFAEHYTTAARK